jgi:hypothetical protein
MNKLRNVFQKIFDSLGVLGIMSIGEKQYKAEIMSGQINQNN